MLNIRKYNLILINTVLLLFLVGLLVGLKILFTGNNIFGGSITDWISALSTAGTLGVAYAAYRKAPEWMAQKHYDIAFSIIENAVFKDLAKVRSSSLHLKSKILRLAKITSEAVKSDKETPQLIIDEMVGSIETNLEEFHQSSYLIINQLKSLTRTNYDVTEYTQNIIRTLQQTAEEYNIIYNQLYMAVGEADALYCADNIVIDTFKKDLHDLQLDAINTNKTLTNTINTIYLENRPIKDFITHKKP